MHARRRDGAAYAWAGQADDARRTLRLAVEKAVDERIGTVHVMALVYQAIVEFEDGFAASAQTAASTAVATAEASGLAMYHGGAPAYAIRARTGGDPAGALLLAEARSVISPLPDPGKRPLVRGFTCVVLIDRYQSPLPTGHELNVIRPIERHVLSG
jgi:hypothetical protein